MFTKNGNILKVNGNWLNPHTEPEPPEPPGPVFDEVTIGSQTWMSKNLVIDDGGEGIYHFDNVTANDVNFGTQYYYTWDAAVRVASSIEGWHLPTVDEWNELANAVGGSDIAGTKLKSTTGWNNGNNGTDDYGFTALPVGQSNSQSSGVIDLGRYARFWTSNGGGAWGYKITLAESGYTYDWSSDWTSNGYSVRLIKDT